MSSKEEKKGMVVAEGRELVLECEKFPEDRSCNDAGWVAIFFVVVLAMIGIALGMGRSIESPDTASLSNTTTARRLQATTCGVYTCQPGHFKKIGFDATVIASMPVQQAEAICCEVTAQNLQAGFGATVGVPPAYKAVATGGNGTNYDRTYFDAKKVKPLYLVMGTVGGAAAAMVAATFLIFLSKVCSKCVVYTSLLFSCALMVVMGIAMITVGAAGSGLPSSFNPLFMFGGCVMIFMGICMGCCILCCWSSFIEFTAAIVKVCGDVTLDNCGMLFVALVGAILSAVWSIIVAFALDGVVAKYQEEITSSKYTAYAVFGGFFFCWIWGCMVSAGVCYTTFCGVFGRWFYSDSGQEEKERYESGVITSSFCAASTTSLGSVCFGTFLVAAVRTAEFVARRCQQDAAQEQNFVLCIILCCVRCILECIGDIIEYFNEWAYVQCAIRNTSFCESAKVVFSLCTSRNVWAIWATLLIDSVVNFGSFLAGFGGAVVGAGLGYIGSTETALLAGLGGFIAGNAVGWCCMSCFSAGAKTLCTCWAENPDSLGHKSQAGEVDLVPWFNNAGGKGAIMGGGFY